MVQDRDKKRDGGGKGPHPALVVIGVVLFGITIWYALEKPEDATTVAPSGDGDTGDQRAVSLEHYLKDLGKTLAIGPEAVALEQPGTVIVDVKEIAGLGERLEGRDVDAVADLLEQNRIKHVLVDPSVTKRNPLPLNTVKNRLALAHPAGRLTAVVLSKKLFVYRLQDDRPRLSAATKKLLTSIARSAFGGGKEAIPDDAEPIVHKKGEWEVILTVRPLNERHISFHMATEKTLVNAARTLGKKARHYYQQRERFKRTYGPLDKALADKLTIELEVIYDVGTYVGERDKIFVWRVVEPGIYGIRMTIDGKEHTLPPWYSVMNNYRLVSSLFERLVERQAEKDKNYWKRDDVPFQRFRTVHWREVSPGGDIQDLYRGFPEAPTTKDITRENLVKCLKGLGDWIADNQVSPDGRYVYRYFPTKDGESDEYNMVRHALGPFSMALTQEFVNDEKYRLKAEAGMRFIEDHIRWGGAPRHSNGEIDTEAKSWLGKPLPGSDVAILEFSEPPGNQWSSKMGAVAVSILGYTQYKRVGWALSKEREKVLQGLANFLLYMQNEAEGSFHHYYVSEKNDYFKTRNSIYPGEILYAVARLYGETKDERFKRAFQQSMAANLKWFKEQMAKRLPDGTYEEEHRKNLVQFQPWMAMAMDEMYRYDPDPAYVEASNLVSLWILDTYQFDEKRAFFPDYLGGYMKVLDELPAMHTFVYTEGTAASYDLALRGGAKKEIVDKLRKGALLSARFIIQQQVRPGVNDYHYPNPKKAAGGVRYCMNHNKQRIDYTYHALSSVYRILRAARNEDYSFIHSISSPQTW